MFIVDKFEFLSINLHYFMSLWSHISISDLSLSLPFSRLCPHVFNISSLCCPFGCAIFSSFYPSFSPLLLFFLISPFFFPLTYLFFFFKFLPTLSLSTPSHLSDLVAVSTINHLNLFFFPPHKAIPLYNKIIKTTKKMKKKKRFPIFYPLFLCVYHLFTSWIEFQFISS